MAQPPSVVMGCGAEECGRPTREDGRRKKRTYWVLEQEASGNKEGKGKFGNGGSRKQRTGGDIPGKKIQDIRNFFEAKGGDNSPLLGKDLEERKGDGTQCGPLQ